MHPSLMRAVVIGIALAAEAAAQTVPDSPGKVWSSPAENTARAELARMPESRADLKLDTAYSLAQLIDFAEQHNPETRVLWEQARQQAARLGIARSSLYPVLAASALLQQNRNRVLFGTAFFRQDLTLVQPTLSLFYTVFDFGRRRAHVEVEKAALLAAGFSFNETHERIIFAVTTAYYELVSARGQVDATEATLRNSQAVQQAVEERLKNGLATLPDALEARAATAQAVYDLETARGAERVAHGRLAQALGVSPVLPFQVESLSSKVPADLLQEPLENAITRALSQRPDLLAQMERLHEAEGAIKAARSRYFPTLSFSGEANYQFMRGMQQGDPPVTTNGDTSLAQLSLRWTIFDGRARYNELDRARSEYEQARAELSAMRDRAEVEVWTAYSNMQTALRQQDAAIALLDAANQQYAAALEAYKYGVKSFLDVVSAQRTLAQARTADVIARARIFTNITDLAFRTGDLLRTHAGTKKP